MCLVLRACKNHDLALIEHSFGAESSSYNPVLWGWESQR